MAQLPAAVAARFRPRPAPAPADPAAGASTVVSIVLSVYDPPISALRAQLTAIASQTHRNWECIVVDDASPSPAVGAELAAWCSLDERRTLVTRPVNGGIAAATNDGLDRATGDIVTFCDHDDLIDPEALEHVVAHFDAHPDHDLVYTDEQMVDEDGRLLYVYCKPDFSPHRLLGHNYLNHLTAIRRRAIGDLRIRREFEPSQDYDFYLRVIEEITRRGRGVGHIPKILYSWRAIAGSVALDAAEKSGVASAVERCVAAAVERRDLDAAVVPVSVGGRTATSMRLQLPTSNRTTEFVDASTGSAEVAASLVASTADVVCLTPFDDSADHSWAAPLVDRLDLPAVGAVGPRLVAPDGTLLSVGRTVAPQLTDPFRGEPADLPGPWDVFLVAREVSALAPVGLALDRRAVAAVGGLAGHLGLDAAVAELCVRLRAAGHATVLDPAVALVCDPAAVPDPTADHRIDDDLARAALRVPDVRTEHFAPTGTAPLVGSEPPAVTALRRAIAGGHVELVTSDVFDTIVDRGVTTPSDLFVTLADALHGDGHLAAHVTPALFARARIDAEARVRQRRADEARDRHAGRPVDEVEQRPDVAAPEVTLAEIWDELPNAVLASPRPPSPALIDAELAHEAANLRPIPPAIDTLCFAVEQGLTVHLVSDTYLSADQLRTLLDRVGVDRRLLRHVTTSADHRLGKAHGLLRETIAASGCAPAATVHVGDNPIADIATAEEIGATAIAVDVMPADQHVSMPSRHVAAISRSKGTDGGVRSAVRATLVAAGSLGGDPSYQFGAAIAGPAVAGFARWVATTTTGLGATTVHCLLREGATIASLMETVAPDGPDRVLLHASRWVNMRAAVIDGTPEELLTAIARRATLTPRHVANSFGCDEGRVAAVLGADEVPHSHLPAACRRIMGDDVLRTQILDASADLRRRLVRYLRTAMVIGDGPIVVADVGWGGTIQEGLTRVLRAEGVDNEVVGLYFALSAPGEVRQRRGARMLAYLPTEVDDVEGSRASRAVSHNAEIIERILTPQLGTLIDIDEHGQPVCRPDDDDRIPPTLHSAQRGMAATVARLAARSGGIDDGFFVDDPAVRRALAESVAEVIDAPSRPVAEALSGWPHDDVAGTAHRAIGGDGLTTALRYANAHDLDLIGWNESAWISGLAAQYNPGLRTQLQAVQHGIPADALTTPSENGASSLAAFAFGSEVASLLDERVGRSGADGWSLARVRGSIESLRAVQFRAGTETALVEIDTFHIRSTDASGHAVDVDVDDLTSGTIGWHDARPVDHRRFVHRPGGHLVVPTAEHLGRGVRHVEVTVGFRCWVLETDHPLTRTPLTAALAADARRVAGGVARRLRS